MANQGTPFGSGRTDEYTFAHHVRPR